MKLLKTGLTKQEIGWKSAKAKLDPHRNRSADGKKRQAMYRHARWKELRKRHLARFPYCEECMLQYGDNIRGNVVDHVMGHNRPNWKELFFDPNNLMTLCYKHHNQKTKAERPDSGGKAFKRNSHRLSASKRKDFLRQIRETTSDT